MENCLLVFCLTSLFLPGSSLDAPLKSCPFDNPFNRSPCSNCDLVAVGCYLANGSANELVPTCDSELQCCYDNQTCACCVECCQNSSDCGPFSPCKIRPSWEWNNSKGKMVLYGLTALVLFVIILAALFNALYSNRPGGYLWRVFCFPLDRCHKLPTFGLAALLLADLGCITMQSSCCPNAVESCCSYSPLDISIWAAFALWILWNTALLGLHCCVRITVQEAEELEFQGEERKSLKELKREEGCDLSYIVVVYVLAVGIGTVAMMAILLGMCSRVYFCYP